MKVFTILCSKVFDKKNYEDSFEVLEIHLSESKAQLRTETLEKQMINEMINDDISEDDVCLDVWYEEHTLNKEINYEK